MHKWCALSVHRWVVCEVPVVTGGACVVAPRTLFLLSVSFPISARASQNRLCQPLVDLAVARNGLLALAIGPHVVPTATSCKAPSAIFQLPLKIATLHALSVHQDVCDVTLRMAAHPRGCRKAPVLKCTGRLTALSSCQAAGPLARRPEPPRAAPNCTAAWRAHLAPSEVSSVAAPALPRWGRRVRRLAA